MPSAPWGKLFWNSAGRLNPSRRTEGGCAEFGRPESVFSAGASLWEGCKSRGICKGATAVCGTEENDGENQVGWHSGPINRMNFPPSGRLRWFSVCALLIFFCAVCCRGRVKGSRLR